jgi:hypothetical protein
LKSLFLLDVKLSLLFISELLKVVSTGVGVLFTVIELLSRHLAKRAKGAKHSNAQA